MAIVTINERVTKGKDPQFLVLRDVPQDATLKVELEKEKGSDLKFYKPINLAFLLELQNKIEYSLTGQMLKQFHKTILGAGNTPCISMAKIDLAFGGEVFLGQNDALTYELKGVDDGLKTMHKTFEGVRVSPNMYTVKELTYKKENDNQKVDLSTCDFLVFDIAKVPTEIEFRVKDQKITRLAEDILIDQQDKFNTVGYNADGTPIFGTNKAVVIDVRACNEVIMEQADMVEDLTYFTVKTPF